MKTRAIGLGCADTIHGTSDLISAIENLDVHRWAVPVGVSSDTSIPVTLGVFKPCILFPESAANWSMNRLRMVLKHEMAHVSRRDVLWQLSAAIAKGLFWFQPLAWIAERKMQLEREQACDDWVINRNENACEYASVLLGFAAELSDQDFELAGALFMAQKPIEQRLKTILEPLTPRGVSAGSFRWVIGLMFAAVLVSVCTIRPFGQPIAAATSEGGLFAPQPDPSTSASQLSPSINQDRGVGTGDWLGQPGLKFQADAASKLAWQILLEHYVEHSDINLMIGSSYQQFVDPTTNQFIDAIKKRNPHAHVQAAILYNECELFRDVVVQYPSLVRNNWKGLPNQKWVEFLKNNEPVAATTKVRSIVAGLVSKYPNVVLSSFGSEGMGLGLDRHYSYEKRGKTFAADAKRFLFQVERLIPGQPVPDIVGEDVLGEPFKLSDLAGKAVLLSFAAEWGGDPKNIYEAFRKLKTKHKDQPFEIVTVMIDRKLETSKEVVESGQITWQTVWDGNEGPIGYQWNARSLPSTYYLIDHKGVIIDLSSHRDSYEPLIEELIAEAKK